MNKIINKEVLQPGYLLAGPILGGALGLAISYLFRPWPVTLSEWFTKFAISREYGSIIVICGTMGAVIGIVFCWFAYLIAFKKEFTIENKIWFNLLMLVLSMGVVMIIIIESGLISFFFDRHRILEFLNSLGPLSFIGFIFLQASQVIISPIPGEVTGLIGGFLYGKFIGIILSTIGLTAGSLIAFSLSRWLGRPFVKKFVKKETLDRYDYLLHHKGAFLVFLLFLVPGFPKDLLCYILGLGHLNTKEFFVISTTGRFMGTVLLTLGGDYIRHHQYYRFFILSGVAIVFIMLSMVYRDKIEKLLKKMHSSKKKTGDDSKIKL